MLQVRRARKRSRRVYLDLPLHVLRPGVRSLSHVVPDSIGLRVLPTSAGFVCNREMLGQGRETVRILVD